jgi:hypothetical protein
MDDVSYIKIDVEGHELDVLEGGRKTMARCRPVVLAEVKESNLSAVADYFSRLGYRECYLREVIGVAPTPANHLFVPC